MMHKLGGISSGVNVFNMAILPALVNNAETWIQAPSNSIGRLDNLQNILMRCLLAVPNSAPIPSLNWDIGLVFMEQIINQKKLMFLHYLRTLDNQVLAKEIFLVQKESNFPGYVPEVRNLISLYELPNILDTHSNMSKDKWARLVKEAIKKYFETELRNKMMNGYSKLKNSKLIEEHLGMKDCVTKMTLSDARTNFRIRSSMVNNVKLNQRSNPEYERKLWLCDECGKVDSQNHIMW
jgi:hypothetical protein